MTIDLPRRKLLTMALGTAVGGAAAVVAGPPALGWTRQDVVGDWFDILAGLPPTTPPGQGIDNRVRAISWMSARRALQAKRPGSEDAAVATAVHDVVAALRPDQTAMFDAALARSLDAIPAGQAKQAGIRAGQDAAAAVLADREGDGLDPASINRRYLPPPEAPGVYRLPPGATATQGAGLGLARPFLLGRADRFRPGPPPALGTERYRRDLSELYRFGGVVSKRTEWQSDIAWLDPGAQYMPALSALVHGERNRLSWKVRLLAAFATTAVDAQIAVSDAKFAHLHWRPVTAIRAADTDGDPRTRPDPNWTSYLPTPPNPEWPSGHGAGAGAAEQVLQYFTGPRTPVGFTATVTRGDGRVATLDYPQGTPWTTLTQQNIDARVWAGVHFRFSDEAGATLGRRVAGYNLHRLT